MKFDSKTGTPENFLVTLQTNAMKAYPDPDPRVVAPIDALAVCETTAITLPSIEQATYLGFGYWLIQSANADFTLSEASSLTTSSSS